MNKDDRSILEKIKDEAGQSLTAGVIAIIASKLILDVDLSMNIKYLSMEMPLWGAIGLTVAGADAIAYASHDFIVEKIPQLQSLGNIENRVAAPLLSGLATFALISTTISPDVSIINSAGLGAVSSIGGRYAFSMIQDKM